MNQQQHNRKSIYTTILFASMIAWAKIVFVLITFGCPEIYADSVLQLTNSTAYVPIVDQTDYICVSPRLDFEEVR